MTQNTVCRLSAAVTLAGLLAISGCGRDAQNRRQPRAVRGVLDLSDWDFNRAGPVDLDGEYEFYWQHFLTPQDFSSRRLPPVYFMPVPDSWKGYEIDGQKLPGSGYATYRLTILLNRATLRPALKFLDMGTAYSVFANGRPILTVGSVGQTAETSAPRYFPQIVEVPADSNRLELLFLVSNFHHNRGGVWEEIRLGTREQLNRLRDRRVTLDLIMFGSIFSLGLYHLTLFSLRKNDRASLLFGLYCLLVAVRLLTTMERFLLQAFPAMNWELFVKIEYLSFYPAVAIFAKFIGRLFPQDIHRSALRTIAPMSLTAAGIVVLTPARIFTQTLFAFQIFTIAALAYGFILLILCVRRKREGAALILTGFLFLAAAVVNDILNAHEIIQTGHIVHFGLFIFIFSHAFVLSSRYAGAFKTIEQQREDLVAMNKQLETEIAERQQAEEKLRESEKLAATGRMAARIAHEINNPLATIKTAFHLIRRTLPEENRYYHYLGKIDQDLNRISGIVYQMLDLYSPELNVARTFRLDTYLREMIAAQQSAVAPHQIEIKLDVANAAGAVHLPEGRLREVLTALIQNAVAVSPPGGQIRITAALEQQTFKLSVSDQGRGIAPKDRPHIFEPFYTTNNGSANGIGLGLGLSVCKSLVEAMNGVIEFESKSGEGTEFRIAIPIAQNNDGAA